MTNRPKYKRNIIIIPNKQLGYNIQHVIFDEIGMNNNPSHPTVKLKPDKKEYWDKPFDIREITRSQYDQYSTNMRVVKFDTLKIMNSILNNTLSDENKKILCKVLDNLSSGKYVHITPPGRGGIPSYIIYDNS